MNNLAVRTVSGVAFLIIMVGCILLNKFLFLALMLFIITMLMHEFHQMNMGNTYPVQQVLSVFTGLTLFILMFCHSAYGIDIKYVLLTFIPFFALVISLLAISDKKELSKASHLYNSILYLALPVSLYNMLVFNNYHYSGLTLLWFFVIVWISDVGAYCFGMTLGRRGPRLCPSISPKKSWIGAIGGFIVSVAAGAILNVTGCLPYSIWHCMAIAAVIDVIGVIGDLYESLWKRHYDIKDSGNIIPGHGGMMDRMDSAIMAIPAAIVYMIIFGLI